MTAKSAVRALRNTGLAFGLVYLMLFVFLFDLDLWSIPWTALFAFFLFEFLQETIIGGGKGVFLIRKTRFWKQRMLHKGHAFLALFITILTVTFVSAGIADFLVSFVRDEFKTDFSLGLFWGLFWNFVAGCGVLWYLQTFYSKPQA